MRNASSKIDQGRIAAIVKGLFSNGMTPLKHCGIDEDHIRAIEMKHPEIAKQIPLSAT